MKNIPFPNPHDADALNDYLDALAAGKHVSTEDDVQKAAADVQMLAKREMPSIPEHSTGVHTGGETMQTAAYSPPISNRTRRARAAKPKTSRLEPWLSGLLVAGLLVSMIGYVWWNGPGGGDDNENLAWAPQTASPIAEEPFVWSAPISPEECPENETRPHYDPDNPSGTQYTQAAYDQVSVDRNYEIVGPANTETASAVVNQIREWQGCIARGKFLPISTARFEYETRTTAGRNALDSIKDQRSDGADMVANWYEAELGLTPADMVVYQNTDDLALDGSEALVTQSLFNPDYALKFADGRIGVIHSVVTFEPIEHEIAPYYPPTMLIFVNQDGKWMLDEHLPICFGDCAAMATPASAEVDYIYPVATPAATPES